MKIPTDRQPPRRALGDVRGQDRGERASEYFDFKADPEKAGRKVTRAELLFWLSRSWLIEREKRWYRRIWRYLVGKRGSPPVPVGDMKDPTEASA